MKPEEFPTLQTALQEPHALLEVAQARFDDVWNNEELSDMLANVVARGAVTPVELETLRRLRKRGLEVRTGLEMLTADHKAPKSFRRFLKAIGDTKDNAQMEERREIDTTAIERYVQKREEHALPCVLNAQECLARMKDVTKAVRKQLEKRKLSFPEFHDLRKDGVRHIANVYRLHKRFHKNEPALAAFAYWDGVNRKLGKVQDILIALERLPKKERPARMDEDVFNEELSLRIDIRPKRELVKIDADLREQMLEVLKHIRKERA